MSVGDFNCPRCGERLPAGYTRCDACGAHLVPPTEAGPTPRDERSHHPSHPVSPRAQKKGSASGASRMTGSSWMLLVVGLLCGGALGYTLRGAVGPREEGGMPSGPADVMSGMSGGMDASGNGGAVAGGAPDPMPEQVRQMVAEFRERIDKNPSDTEAHIGLGNLLFDSRQWDRAIEHYQKALDQNPKNADVRVDMAIAYHQLGQNDRAAKEMERVTSETPGHRNAWLNLGVVSAAMGDNARAIRSWEQYLKLEPNSPHSAALRAQIEDLKRGS